MLATRRSIRDTVDLHPAIRDRIADDHAGIIQEGTLAEYPAALRDLRAPIASSMAAYRKTPRRH